MNLRQHFAQVLTDLAEVDKQLCVVVGDIGHGVFKPFYDKFPDRYFNIGILEQAMVSVGAGLAASGMKPILHTIAPFMLERAYESLKLDFVYQKLGGTLITVGSTFDYSNLGCTHHCYHDFALAKSLENTEYFFPASGEELKLHIKSSYGNDKLSIIRVPTQTHNQIFLSELETGKAAKITEGNDLTIVVCGPLVDLAKKVQKKLLDDKNIKSEILYMHTIKPFDEEAVFKSVEKTRKVIVIEEHGKYGGISEDVLRAIIKIPKVDIECLSTGTNYVRDYGSYQDLLNICGLSLENLYKTACRMVV